MGPAAFSSDAFSFVTLTDSINKLPFVPGRLGALGLFTEAPVPTTSIALEEQASILTLVNPTPRGGPGETRPKPLRRARVLKVPHYQLDDNVLAEEVQNVREFGPQMEPRSVETYLSGRMEMFTTQLDVTTEFQRVGAIKGLIVDRDGNTIYDLFSEFGVTAVTPSTSPWATPIPPSARSAASWCGRCRRPWAASPSPASMASAAMRSGTT